MHLTMCGVNQDRVPMETAAVYAVTENVRVEIENQRCTIFYALIALSLWLSFISIVLWIRKCLRYFLITTSA